MLLDGTQRHEMGRVRKGVSAIYLGEARADEDRQSSVTEVSPIGTGRAGWVTAVRPVIAVQWFPNRRDGFLHLSWKKRQLTAP